MCFIRHYFFDFFDFSIIRMRPRYQVKDKVLCYEPDRTKARVLYDATIQVRKLKFYFRILTAICYFRKFKILPIDDLKSIFGGVGNIRIGNIWTTI